MPTTANSKLPYPASTDPADVPADLQKLAVALDQLAYVEYVAPVSVTTTSEAGAASVVAAPAITFDGATPVVVEFYAPQISIAAAGVSLNIGLFQDGSSIGAIGHVYSPGATLVITLRAERRLTPSAGSHTYSVRAWVNVATGGTVGGGPGGAANDVPGYIRIRRA